MGRAVDTGISKGIEKEEFGMKPLCQTCINIFHFPECCTENSTDCVRLIANCRNYSGHDMGEIEKEEKESEEE